MYAAAFEYVRAGSWQDAVERLVEGGEDGRVIAGGQSLVPMMLLRLAEPTVLVDVGGAGERTIERRDSTVVVSALVRHVDLESSAAVREACPMLAEAAGQVGNLRVRNRGTIGGSLAHGEATAEFPCVSVALGATVYALSPRGERAIPASELFVTHLTTTLASDEVITRVELPVLGARQGSCFVELARRPGDFALAEAAAVVTLSEDRRCADLRLVVGAVSDRAVDCSQLASGLRGQQPEAESVDEVSRAVAAGVEVGPSSHASEDYRREMVAVLVKRALLTASARVGDAG
jgi:carbon-monoxide dehydrogenase medium subunit